MKNNFELYKISTKKFLAMTIIITYEAAIQLFPLVSNYIKMIDFKYSLKLKFSYINLNINYYNNF